MSDDNLKKVIAELNATLAKAYKALEENERVFKVLIASDIISEDSLSKVRDVSKIKQYN